LQHKRLLKERDMDLLSYLRRQLSEASRIRAKTSKPHMRIFFDGQCAAYADALAAAELASEGRSLGWATGTPDEQASESERVTA
jgi:hypothetical protein